MQSLFSKTVRVGAVQALLLTSGWNDSGWLCGGHAVRLGMDIGCNEAFYKLLATGMGAGKTGDELEADRVLVSKARVGFVLFNFDNQVSGVSFSLPSPEEIRLTLPCLLRCLTEMVSSAEVRRGDFELTSDFLLPPGRTPIVQVDEAILRCQELLKHPLSIETDIKVVSTTELMTIRGSFTPSPPKLVAGRVELIPSPLSFLRDNSQVSPRAVETGQRRDHRCFDDLAARSSQQRGPRVAQEMARVQL